MHPPVLDPLLSPPDPRLYVPIESLESALSTLDWGLRAGCSPVLVSGPRGIGKTLLLRVLAERAWSSFARTRYSARLTEEPDDLAGSLLLLLFGITPPRRAKAAEAALLEELTERPRTRVLWLVDDIHRASPAHVRKIGELAHG